MQKFGEIFKKFRESRGIRLKDVAKAGISTSQLSRFEKGQTDLTITKFMLILDEINMPIDEFMYAVHDFHRDELNELLAKIQLFVSTHDIYHESIQKAESLLIVHSVHHDENHGQHT